jgi:hypothetical protein
MPARPSRFFAERKIKDNQVRPGRLGGGRAPRKEGQRGLAVRNDIEKGRHGGLFAGLLDSRHIPVAVFHQQQFSALHGSYSLPALLLVLCRCRGELLSRMARAHSSGFSLFLAHFAATAPAGFPLLPLENGAFPEAQA